MTVKVPDVGERRYLDCATALLATNTNVRLYKNNYTPVDASVKADFTEADFSGYASGTFTLGAAATVGGKAKATAAAANVFVHNGGGTANTIYGYYLTASPTDSVVLWAERFAAPVTMSVVGNTISILLETTLGSEA